MKISSAVYLTLFAVFFLQLLFSCQILDNKVVPTITVVAVTNILATSATSGGEIISDGGEQVTARGFCWSTSPNPTLADSHNLDGSGTGSFTSSITGLTPGVTYNISAYAVNSGGAVYSSPLTFSTMVADIDNNFYHTVTIGNQEWMVENLKVTHYRNGDPIPNITKGSAWGGLNTGAYCDYNNEPVNSVIYGRLYNSYAVSDSRNIAPEGWHIATDEEWHNLVIYLDTAAVPTAVSHIFYNLSLTAGGKLKETGITHWQTPNTGATNETGFTALPGGQRNFTGAFSNVGTFGNWWSPSTSAENGTLMQYMEYNTNYITWIKAANETGLSVRCVRD